MNPEQRGLFEDEEPGPVGLPCSFGVHHHSAAEPCAGCAAEEARLCAEFEANVRAGVYDVEGYTPAERRAQALRAVERAGMEDR